MSAGEVEVRATADTRATRSTQVHYLVNETVVHPWRLWAHTSPIYVTIEGQPIRVASDAAAMADRVRLCMEHYSPGGYYRGGRFAHESQLQQLLDNCRQAIRFYEAGSTVPNRPTPNA